MRSSIAVAICVGWFWQGDVAPELYAPLLRPSELRRAASQPSRTESRRLNASLFPTGTRFVSAQAVQAIFPGSGIEENWSAFRRQFRSKGWLAFSAGLFADDQLNALVYYEARCGGLCGEGGYVWLRRDTPSSPWRIAKKIVAWMSRRLPARALARLLGWINLSGDSSPTGIRHRLVCEVPNDSAHCPPRASVGTTAGFCRSFRET
jgi:hypothetical protein